MIIALASPPIATSIDDGLGILNQYVADAAAQDADIVCFPEAWLPGLRGQDFDVAPFVADDLARVVRQAAEWARLHAIALVLGTETFSSAGRHIASCVIDAGGNVLGYQTKNQLDPTEEANYVPGTTRRLFEVQGMKFGIATCHEGWRYPETVRWAAIRGAKVVFHPQLTGSDRTGVVLAEWGAAANPYYEKAMMLRSRENTIYFASVNYGVRYQESATSLIAPNGECQAYLPYGTAGLLVQELDLASATGLLAMRYAPERYAEDPTPAGRTVSG